MLLLINKLSYPRILLYVQFALSYVISLLPIHYTQIFFNN